MAVRQDGCETQKRLLAAAARVFAEKGYRETTIAYICRTARTNVAAVNYHFGSKEGLYAAVWRQAFHKSMEVYPPDGGVPDTAPAKDRLRALITSHVHRVLDKGALGHAGQILLMEMSNPTEAIQKVIFEAVRPLVARTKGIIQELLGPEASEQEVAFCVMSVVHQCFAFSHRRCKHPPALQLGDSETLADALAGHITAFSLAGIAGVRRQIAKQASAKSFS